MHTIPQFTCYKHSLGFTEESVVRDFVLFVILDFYLVLGLEWLNTNHAIGDCDLCWDTLNSVVGVSVRFLGGPSSFGIILSELFPVVGL